MDKTREAWNRLHVVSAVGVRGDDIGTVIKTVTDGWTITEAEAAEALTSLVESGRVTRTGYGQSARFSLNPDWQG